jgi:hypothetical protein
MFTGRMGRISVFCSYAREDEAIRQALERHLAPLREEEIIDDWYDSRIQPGARWDTQIQQALDRCRLMIFLVTPDLLSSRYVSEVEIPKGLERERAGECRVVPIMARAADWSSSPLARFQALPGGGRWVDSTLDRNAALREIAAGIREVCRRIVDWENPYRRARVGDWTYQEQTMTTADGQSATAQGTEELVARSDTQATLRLELVVNGQYREQTMTIDLTRPLEDRMGDMLRQTGVELPANVEISVGPALYGDEHVTIGGRRYETVRARRDLTIAQRAFRQSGKVTQWRSIDVPLFGLVKGEAELPVSRQYQVLLDYGHGDADQRKPRLGGASREHTATPVPPVPGSGAAAGGYIGWGGAAGGRGSGDATGAAAAASGWGATAPMLIGPGRWLGQVNTFGALTSFDLLLHPNGSLQGQQQTAGMLSDLHGQWSFDASSRLLTMQVVTSMMGVPTSHDLVQVCIVGWEGALLQGRDAAGRPFVLQRMA